MCSPSHIFPWQTHPPKCRFGERTTQWNDWHLLFEFFWHKQYELFLCYLHVYSHSQGPENISYPPASTCIFCRWVQVCYGYGWRQSVCLGYPKQSSFKDIHASPQVRLFWPAGRLSSIQQWKTRKRSSGICRGTSDVYILISLPLK